MEGKNCSDRADRRVPRRVCRRRLHRAAVLVAASLLTLVVVPGVARPALADQRMSVTPVDVLAPHTAACSAVRRTDCTTVRNFVAGGLIRRAYVYLPPAAGRGPVPLVVAVHGYRQSPRTFDDQVGLTAFARGSGFAIAFPQGYGEQSGSLGYLASWDAGTCCGPAARDRVDDMAMMNATVAAAKTVVRSDGRVYYLGNSNGAMLGYRLWCEGGGPFRAFVAVHGTLTVRSCTPRTTRPFLAMHALRDATVPYAGCTQRQLTSSCATYLHSDLLPGSTAVSILRRAAGCTGSITRRYAPHVLISVATRCKGSGATQLTIDDAGHPPVRDPRIYGIDEIAQAWAFLRRF
jgi:polyhydroxybutyrate depolymerase